MKKALLVAEKPALKRTIEAVYNKHRSEIPYDITFMDQRGHLLTLKTPDEIDEEMKKWCWETIPFNPEEHGGWHYKVIQEKKVGSYLTAKERYAVIKKELSSGKYDCVINAGDPDQEGQLLIRIVLASLKNSLPVLRYWSNDTTEGKVLDALKNLRDDDHDSQLTNLLQAAYGRQHSDYRFGMNISRASTLKMGVRVACGRVKTPILAIVCKRENEIKNFKPSTCYGVKAVYSEGFEGQMFDSSSKEDTGEKEDEKNDSSAGLIWFDTEAEANEAISELSSPGKVTSYIAKRVESYAPKLLKLSTAQIAAGKYGFSSSQTLDIIQGLYERGFLSYPRTDCEYISSHENLNALLKSASSVPELSSFVDAIDPSIIGKVKSTKKWVDDKKLEEAGHSALIPTTSKPDFSALSEDEKIIYTLVCKQFVAIFLPPLIQDKTALIVDIKGKSFKSTGKTFVDAGYTKIFGTKFTDAYIPEHKEGDSLTVDEFNTVTKTTVCPKHLTDADIIAICEAPHKYLDDPSLKRLGKKLVIGTPASRASIIKELIFKDKYLQQQKEKKTTYIIPSVTGAAIYENLKDCDICKVDVTGEWEEKLELIRTGKMELSTLEQEMKKHVADMVEEIKNADMTTLAGATRRAVVTKCPSCGGDIISGPKGFYCSKYKEGCQMGAYKIICDSVITDAEFADLINGKEITKEIKKGSSKWNQALKYNSETHRIEFVEAEKINSEHLCPKCGQTLMSNGQTLKCGCGFTFWLSAGHKALSKEQVDKFFKTGTTGIVKGMTGKSGKKFDAEIILKSDKSGTEFKFSNGGK